MIWPLVKLISGAQSGADQAGLFSAEAVGVATGGYCTRGCRTESGDRPDLIARFGLTELPTDDYSIRTLANVKAAGGTVIFGDVTEPGSALTCRYVQIELGERGLLINPTAKELRDWIMRDEIRVLNVAGNRLSKLGVDGYNDVCRVVSAAVAPVGVLVVAPPLIGQLEQARRHRNGWLGGR